MQTCSMCGQDMLWWKNADGWVTFICTKCDGDNEYPPPRLHEYAQEVGS